MVSLDSRSEVSDDPLEQSICYAKRLGQINSLIILVVNKTLISWSDPTPGPPVSFYLSTVEVDGKSNSRSAISVPLSSLLSFLKGND